MTRSVNLAELTDLETFKVIAVPLVTREGTLAFADGVPATIAGVTLPTALTAEWCESQGLKTKVGSTAVLRNFSDTTLVLMVTNGIETTLEEWRQLGAAVAKVQPKTPAALLVSLTPNATLAKSSQAITEGVILASYDYKKPESAATVSLMLVGDGAADAQADVVRGVQIGSLVADGANWAKRLVDMPAQDLSPKAFATFAKERLEGLPHVDIEIWKDTKIAEERLGGLIGVNLGSAQPARLVIATYTPPSTANQPHIILVGKGVTFDSGGLSLKTGEGMMTMKTDMTGAAVVTAVLAAAAELGLPIRVTAIAPLTENMTGPAALRPGDVLKIRNGTTVEVLNTDAEGRLILADALSLAAEQNPDAIIDVATLTGAQAVALGDEIGAVFASRDDLAAQLLAASERSGETMWRMPLHPSYESHIDSDVADIKNIGKAGRAGSISAALFLQRFVNGLPWAHLDIAGPSRMDATRGYYQRGGSAYGARTLVEYLIERSGQA